MVPSFFVVEEPGQFYHHQKFLMKTTFMLWLADTSEKVYVVSEVNTTLRSTSTYQTL